MTRLTCFAIGAMACVLTACSTTPTARVEHVLLFKLDDPREADALIADSHEMLDGMPGVVSVTAGRPLGVERPIVDGDYDVALIVGFASEDAYAAYLEHPDHERTSHAWRPRLEWVRAHDVVTE
ncbi:MAG: Dabb family protein [Planctomycetota bacterium]|jgi:hypothetical protein